MYHMDVMAMLLADAARVESGKLYVFGGGWDRINAISFPTTHPSMAVAVILQVEYDEALAEHLVEIGLMKDGRVAGPVQQMSLNVGHSPGMTRGAPTFVPLSFTYYELPFAEPGRYEWVLSIDQQVRRPHPMELSRVPQPSAL
jgi:hypothetical protein